MANKQVTINEMIYNTLRTKSTNTPKYYDILVALGYKLHSDSEWSAFDYWEIETDTGDRINISKGYDNRTRLYITAKHVSGDYKKVDYVNLIKMQSVRKGNRPVDHMFSKYSPYRKRPRIERYLYLKEHIKDSASLLDYYNKNFAKAEEAYEKAKKDMEEATSKLVMANDEMLQFKEEIRQAKNKH